MRVLDSLRIENFRGLEDVVLDKLSDINIIVGPNNSGKTSILDAIDILSKTKTDAISHLDCETCERVITKSSQAQQSPSRPNRPPQPQPSTLVVPEVAARAEDTREGSRRYSVTFTFNADLVRSKWDSYPGKSRLQFKEIEKVPASLASYADEALHAVTTSHIAPLKLAIEQSPDAPGEARGAHLSIMHLSGMMDHVLGPAGQRVLLCPDSRLDTYKGSALAPHIQALGLSGGQLNTVGETLGTTVDARIRDLIPGDFDVLRRDGTRGKLLRQGSGIRAIVCLLADIMKVGPGQMVLIDEPESGLNQHGKGALLGHIVAESRTRQFFLTTHDPTFVNPLLYDRERCSVYVYSHLRGTYVKVNLAENKQDPAVFAGFLSHTHSMRRFHVYVEGSQDTYIFKDMVRKYLRKQAPDTWWRLYEDVGVYHLSGDNWMHLAGTMPGSPYRCILVLDGNKTDLAKETAAKLKAFYEHTTFRRTLLAGFPQVEYCGSPEDVERCVTSSGSCPIFCMSKDDISEYFLSGGPGPKTDKWEAVKLAVAGEDNIPAEFERLFTAFLGPLLASAKK
jgi:energy-coupling factor transporter ATP-binding protein EcfA2